MRRVEVVLAVSLLANVGALASWATGTDRAAVVTEGPARDPARAPAAAAEGAAAPERGAADAPNATPLARAPRAAPAAPGSAAPAVADDAAAAAALGRALTPDEAARLAAFVAERRARLPTQFAAAVRADEARRVAEIEASRVAELDAMRGGPVEFLRGARDTSQRLPEFVRGTAFDRWFTPVVAGRSTVLTPGAKAPERPVAGDTFVFGPGAHTFRVSGWRGTLPADLTFEGAGKDLTIVTFDEFQASDGPISVLTFHDLTVDCGDHYLTDLRGGHPSVITFERCRLIGFDMGAGGSVALATGPLALRMTDCVVETGYGRSPPYGNLLRTSERVLARCTGTTFRGLKFGDVGNGSTIVLDGCRVEPGNVHEASSWRHDAIVVGETTTVQAPPPEEAPERRVRRRLAELNPSWPDRK